MVGDPEQCIGIGRKIDADDIGLLVDDEIDEAGILMAEAVMVLPPDMRRQQIVERGDRASPGQATRNLQPFGMLVEHRIHDVNKGLIAGEEAVPAGEQISLEPALAKMLAQHLHHAAVLGQMDVVGLDALHPDPLGDVEHCIEPVRRGLVRSHDAEISRLGIQRYDLAEELPHDTRRFALRRCRGSARPPHRRENPAI